MDLTAEWLEFTDLVFMAIHGMFWVFIALMAYEIWRED
jgi:hypothetical protein